MRIPEMAIPIHGPRAVRATAWIRRVRLLLLGLSPILLCACQFGGRQLPQTKKPNIVLIVVDALRAGNVSFPGYERETTPQMDMIARESYVFENAIAVLNRAVQLNPDYE